MDRVIAALEPLLQPRRIERMKSVLASRSDHVAFVFERMVDPHNLSAALRSLDAFSFQDIHLVNPQSPIGFARGITQGSDRWLTVHDSDSLIDCVEGLQAAGYRILASRPGEPGAVSLDEIDFRHRVALVFGNEHDGVSEQVLGLADGRFHIGMYGFVDSLNLSVAAAICAYRARAELIRLMGDEPGGGPYLLSEARRKELYAGWLRRSVRRADEILAETEARKG